MEELNKRKISLKLSKSTLNSSFEHTQHLPQASNHQVTKKRTEGSHTPRQLQTHITSLHLLQVSQRMHHQQNQDSSNPDHRERTESLHLRKQHWKLYHQHNQPHGRDNHQERIGAHTTDRLQEGV